MDYRSWHELLKFTPEDYRPVFFYLVTYSVIVTYGSLICGCLVHVYKPVDATVVEKRHLEEAINKRLLFFCQTSDDQLIFFFVKIFINFKYFHFVFLFYFYELKKSGIQ